MDLIKNFKSEYMREIAPITKEASLDFVKQKVSVPIMRLSYNLRWMFSLEMIFIMSLLGVKFTQSI